MPNYNKSKIYKIYNNDNDIYIGSTIKSLNDRLNYHKCQNNQKYKCSSKIIIEKSAYKIELIENFPCVNDEELRIREQYHINYYRNNNEYNCINKMNSYSSNEDLKKYQKEYYNDNKDKSKEYYENNKDKLNKQHKEYKQYRKTWGGDPRCHNNLLLINPDIFHINSFK